MYLPVVSVQLMWTFVNAIAWTPLLLPQSTAVAQHAACIVLRELLQAIPLSDHQHEAQHDHRRICSNPSCVLLPNGPFSSLLMFLAAPLARRMGSS